MTFTDKDYNTSRAYLQNAEVGRHIQEFVSQIIAEPDKEKRTRMAHTIVYSMGILNPHIKQQVNWEEKFWSVLFHLGGKHLDVDCPYEIVLEEDESFKPEKVPYSINKINYRFYGKTLQSVIEKAIDYPEGTDKQFLVNQIASFMFNASKNWNNENLSNEAIASHLESMSKGKLLVNPDDIEVSPEAFVPKPVQNNNQQRNKQNNNRFGKQNNNNNNNNNNNQRKNFRRYWISQ